MLLSVADHDRSRSGARRAVCHASAVEQNEDLRDVSDVGLWESRDRDVSDVHATGGVRGEIPAVQAGLEDLMVDYR